MIPRNPKQAGTCLWDCKPQRGPCPNDCNQCFYNRPNAFYVPIEEPIIPDPAEVGDGIVRMNCGHDSNFERDHVIAAASKYRHAFFNTALPRLDFPGPVVFTANSAEEELPRMPREIRSALRQVMFVRLRVSPTNLNLVHRGIEMWTGQAKIPVVLTFMAYYDQDPPGCVARGDSEHGVRQFFEDGASYGTYAAYTRRRHILNSYWCPTRQFKSNILRRARLVGGHLVAMCGTLDSNFCRDCRNCETYYVQTMKRLGEIQ